MTGPGPDLTPLAYDVEAVPPVVVLPVRRRLASSDPDVLALYERLVIAREGARDFVAACLVEGDTEWYAAGSKVRDLLDRAQQIVEALK